MTPAQEEKLDRLYELTLTLKGDIRVMDQRVDQHKDAILDHERTLLSQNKQIISLDADRNKAKGAIWVGFSSGLLGFFAFVASLFHKS